MKKLIIFLIILTMLTGCVPAKTEVPSETPLPTAAPTSEPTKTALDFKYEVIDFVWDEFWDQKFDSRSIVITGTETLDELEEMIYKSFEGFEYDLPMMQDEIDFLNHYTDSMFTEDGLVLITIHQHYHSSYPDYIVEAVHTDDETMEIELYRSVNTANSEAECNMLIFVELQDFEYTGQEIVVNMIDEREE